MRYIGIRTISLHSLADTTCHTIVQWKSDVWSLGCILYELAVLRSPFKEPGIKLHDLFKKIAKGIFEVSALAKSSGQQSPGSKPNTIHDTET